MADGWAHKGDKVRFLNRNGYDHQLNEARALFKPGAILTVESVNVSSWTSYYQFRDVKGRFNTVMFEPVPEIPTEKLDWVDICDTVLFRARSAYGTYLADCGAGKWRTSASDWIEAEDPMAAAQAHLNDHIRLQNEVILGDRKKITENDLWLTFCDVMGSDVPEALYPLHVLSKIADKLNERYLGGSQPSNKLSPSAQENVARVRYLQHTGSHSTIHCNQFPTWEELSDAEKRKWI